MTDSKYLRRVDGKDDPPDNVQKAVSKYLRTTQQSTQKQPKSSRYLKPLVGHTAGGVEVPYYEDVQEGFTAFGAASEGGYSYDDADEDNQQITDVIRDKQDFRKRLRAALEAEFPEVYNKSKSTQTKTAREMITWQYISELSSSLPTIPLPPDIDLAELKREYKRIFDDENVELFTLPIGAINAESRNGRTYLASAIHDLVTQVNELRPEGMWGHLADHELATRYDPPAIRWLAAKMVNGIAYGLLLPLTPEARDYYRLARATGANVATSITAQADINQNSEVTHLSLHTIDIADPKRVGILATVSKVH